MKRNFLWLSVVMLALVLCLAACGASDDTTAADTTTTEAADTPNETSIDTTTDGESDETTETTADMTTEDTTEETTEEVYYFQTVEGLAFFDSEIRSFSGKFRLHHDYVGNMGDLSYLPEIKPQVAAPDTITVGSSTYTVADVPWKTSTRVNHYGISAEPAYSGTRPSAVFDAYTGELMGLYNFYIDEPTADTKTMSLAERTIAAVEYYMPHIDTSVYTLEREGENTALFRRVIDGWNTIDTVYAFFVNNKLTSLCVYQYNYYTDFDAAWLEDINYEEHQAAIDSLIEYTKNGYEIKEPNLLSKYIVVLPDGRYALAYTYELETAAQTTSDGTVIAEREWYCRVVPCFVIGRSLNSED